MKPKRITAKFLHRLGACSEAVAEFKRRAERDTTKILRLLIQEKHWDWFSWFAPRLMTHKQKVQWAIFCAEQVLDIFENQYPKDARPRNAIKAAKAWLKKPSKNAASAAYAANTSANTAAASAAYAAAYAANGYAASAAYAAAYAANTSAYAKEKLRQICSRKAIKILQ